MGRLNGGEEILRTLPQNSGSGVAIKEGRNGEIEWWGRNFKNLTSE